MPKTMMLSLDLEGYVSDDSRNKVYAKLQELHWSKIPKLTTTWRTHYQTPQIEFAMIEKAKRDVAAATAAGGVARYRAAVLAGENPPNGIWPVNVPAS